MDPVPGHPYAYALNNPATFTDPAGTCVLGLPCPKLPKISRINVSSKRVTAVRIGLSLSPVIGDANDAIAVITGYDIIWGERISREERALYAAGLLFGSGSMYRKGLGLGGEPAHLASKSDIMEFRLARKLTRGQFGKEEAHHILEVRHLKNWKRAAESGIAPSVVLTKEQHKWYTSRLREALPYGREYTVDDVLAGYRRAYEDQPDWLAAVKQFLK